MSRIAHRRGALRVYPAACRLSVAIFLALTFAGAPPARAQGSGWTGSNVGRARPIGRATYGGGIFTIEGGGSRIFSTSDQFFFMYGALTGDATVSARVLGVENTNTLAKAGLMIRDTLAANSKHASIFMTPSGGVAFARRTSTGGTTTQTLATGARSVWLRLVRSGSTVAASRSVNGVTWTTIGVARVSMSNTVYVGLAVSSYDNRALSTAAFSSVLVASRSRTLTSDGGIIPISAAEPNPTVPVSPNPLNPIGGARPPTAPPATPPMPANLPPIVSLTGPAHGSTYRAPATIPLAATAADANGSIARVDFYAGATLLGSDATSPYQFTWRTSEAGSYSLRAIARDNLGATTSSATRTVTVAAAKMPRWAIFVASADHAIVSRYVLEIFVAGTSSLTIPIATRDLGKPSVVGGECSVDIGSTISGLPGGSYFAAVVAVSSRGGRSAKAVSPLFVR